MQNGMLTPHNGATAKLRAFWNRLGVSPPISLHLFSLKRTERSSAESSELCLRHLMFLSPRFAVQRWAKPNSPRSKSVLHMVTIHLPALLVRTSRLAEIVRARRWATAKGREVSEVPMSSSSRGNVTSATWQRWHSEKIRRSARCREAGNSIGGVSIRSHQEMKSCMKSTQIRMSRAEVVTLGGTRRQLASLLRTGPWGEGNESQSLRWHRASKSRSMETWTVSNWRLAGVGMINARSLSGIRAGGQLQPRKALTLPKAKWRRLERVLRSLRHGWRWLNRYILALTRCKRACVGITSVAFKAHKVAGELRTCSVCIIFCRCFGNATCKFHHISHKQPKDEKHITPKCGAHLRNLCQTAIFTDLRLWPGCFRLSICPCFGM